LRRPFPDHAPAHRGCAAHAPRNAARPRSGGVKPAPPRVESPRSAPRSPMTAPPNAADSARPASAAAAPTLRDLVEQVRREEEIIRRGGGAKAAERQHAKNRLTARERIARLLDEEARF